MTETATAPEVKTAEVVKPKIAPRLTPDRIKGAEFARVVYAITPAAGTEVEHLFKPEYWAHVANKLQPHSRIEAISEENTWFAELLVISSGPSWAKVRLLRYAQLEDTFVGETTSENLYEVTWGGVKARFRVVRKSDKVVIKEGFTTKIEAHKWMQDYEMNSLVAA